MDPISREDADKRKNVIRFFKMLALLPMEMQMKVCYAQQGVNSAYIPLKHREEALKRVFKMYADEKEKGKSITQ
jgi:hypothetical protein